MKDSKIEWTDHTVNLWWGCTKVHKGCDNCYAETLANRFGNDIWGNNKPRRIVKSAFSDLNKYQKKAQKLGIKYKIFVGSMMDIFEKSMPLIDSKGNKVISNEGHTKGKELETGHLRGDFFRKIRHREYENLIFLFLTKRPSNINKMIDPFWKAYPPKNVWFGTSPVDQQTFEKLVSQLQKVKGNKFLSIEPQLGEIKINAPYNMGVVWIIQGGESGAKRRPFNLAWAHSMKKQCSHLKIPYFFKQIDKVKPIPENLLIREFPKF